ncbi:TetR/AcrR family transcriptional regulator [uncultured Phascolarctobacterium sp.]|uniref:TetR/AcrR family transcriptional regulator n=1 Tax=Phascolarctobacterium sp. TaxID=2049039 RepID=UPI0025D14C75|nr:TetR/AcrR family transcriptional regulator [uncultured Phascolarctobacterium sp.]
MNKMPTARDCIVEAFLQLCQTLPCDKITVSQLTKKAGYNRSTFYAYFNNTDDLLKQLENELFQIVDTFLPHGIRIFRTGVPTEEERQLSKIFFKNNAPIMSMLLGPNGDPRFVYKMKNHIRQVLVRHLQLTPQQLTPQLQLLMEFVLSGHLQVLVYCYQHNSPISPLDFWLKLISFIDQPALLAAMAPKSDTSL